MPDLLLPICMEVHMSQCEFSACRKVGNCVLFPFE